MLVTYIVRARRASGYALIGPLLPQPLRYQNESDAVSYGHHLCREPGGRILVLNAPRALAVHRAHPGRGKRGADFE